MKKNPKLIIRLSIAAACLLIFIILTVMAGVLKKGQTDQQAESNFATAGGNYDQVSIYLSDDASMSVDTVENLNHDVAKDISTSLGADYEGLQSTDYCYSAVGSIAVNSDRDSISPARIMAVGGDYFTFHPLDLLSGYYFDDDDLMKDYVLLDDNSAGRLFGSADVVGQNIYINDLPYIVVGVYKTPTDKLSKVTGANSGFIYMPYDTANSLGAVKNVTCVEMLAAAPISGTGYNQVKTTLTTLLTDDSLYDIVNNSTRFSIGSIAKDIVGYSERVMRIKAITYPYYENEARATETRLAILLIFRAICLLIPAIMLIVYLTYRYRHRTIHSEDVKRIVTDWYEDRFQPALDAIIRKIRRKAPASEDIDYRQAMSDLGNHEEEEQTVIATEDGAGQEPEQPQTEEDKN